MTARPQVVSHVLPNGHLERWHYCPECHEEFRPLSHSQVYCDSCKGVLLREYRRTYRKKWG